MGHLGPERGAVLRAAVRPRRVVPVRRAPGDAARPRHGLRLRRRFSLPGGRGAVGVEETIRERIHLVPRYRQRIHRVPFNLAHPVWVDDPHFDLGAHIRREVLPPPGDGAALRRLVMRILARPLDMRRPLWEMTIVTGLRGGRVVLVNRAHHAMVDGVSSRRHPDPAARRRPRGLHARAAGRAWKPRPAPSNWQLIRPMLWNFEPAARRASGRRLPAVWQDAAAALDGPAEARRQDGHAAPRPVLQPQDRPAADRPRAEGAARRLQGAEGALTAARSTTRSSPSSPKACTAGSSRAARACPTRSACSAPSACGRRTGAAASATRSAAWCSSCRRATSTIEERLRADQRHHR